MTANEIYTLTLAVYAAVVATIVFAWDVVKWRMSGPRITMSAESRVFIGGTASVQTTSPPFIVTRVTNRGDRATTLAQMGVRVYQNDWLAFVQPDAPEQSFFCPLPEGAQPLPFVIEPGQQWSGMIQQDEFFKRLFDSGKCVMITLHHSHADKPLRVRVEA